MAEHARQVRRIFDAGDSVYHALEWLRKSGASSLEAIKALTDATPLQLSEAKKLADDFESGDSSKLHALTADRLAMLELARGGEYLHSFYRSAVLGGQRWLTLAPATSGFHFWWKQARAPVPEGSWSGQDLPSLAGLLASFRATLAGQPRLAQHVEIVQATDALLTLRLRLEAEL